MKHIGTMDLEVLQEAVDLLKKYPESDTVLKEQCGILIEYSTRLLSDLKFYTKKKRALTPRGVAKKK